MSDDANEKQIDPSASVPNLRLFTSLMSYYFALRESMEVYEQIMKKCIQEQHVSEASEMMLRQWHNKLNNVTDSSMSKFNNNLEKWKAELKEVET